MDNKLSELSKPVAQAYYDEHDSSVMLIDWLVDYVPEAAVLYSQEYVSALLARIAELEANTAMTMGVGSGDGNLFVHGDYDSIKAAQAIVLENESLRAKLATPIKIVNYDEFFICHVSGASDDYCKGWVDGRNAAARDVGKAGFTVEDK